MDYSSNIALDNNGMAHVVFGINRVRKDAPGTSYFLYPGVDGIGYWNETMPTFSDDLYALSPYGDGELIEDYNLIGWSQDVDGNGQITFAGILYYRTHSLSTMPDIIIYEQGIIYVAYASTTETFVTIEGDLNFKHIWMRTSPDGGTTWGDFYGLQGNNIFHLYDECIYPHLASRVVDESVHMLYNADLGPGLAFREDHEWMENQQTYAKIPVMDIVGLDNNPKPAEELSVSQAFPNPATNQTAIMVTTRKQNHLIISLTNTTGQVVYQKTEKNLNAGKHILRIDVSGYTPGIYIYSVKFDSGIKSGKLIIK